MAKEILEKEDATLIYFLPPFFFAALALICGARESPFECALGAQ